MDNFDEILIQYKSYLYYLMRQYNIDTTDDDMYQRALIGLWRASSTFDDTKGVQFLTYATRIITNELFLEMRSRRKQKKLDLVPIDKPISEDDDMTYQEIIPSLETTDCNVVYLDIMSILSEEEKDLVKYVASGYTQYELSEILSTSQPTVYRRIRKIREKVDKYLKKSS